MAEEVETPVVTQPEVKAPTQAEDFDNYMKVMDSPPAPKVKGEGDTPPEEKIETPIAKAEPLDPNAPIDLEDEASTKEKDDKGKIVDAPDADKDFMVKYRAKLKEDFGDDEPVNIKTKLSAEPPKPKYNTELAKLADEYLPKGMSQKDFFTFVATDFKTLDPITLLDFKLSQDNPKLTPEQRSVILSDKYRNFENQTEDEKIITDHLIEMDYKPALAEYEGKKTALINDKFEAPKAAEPDPQIAIQQAAQKEYWKKEAPNVIKALDKLTFDIKLPKLENGKEFEDSTISVNISAAQKKLMEDFISNHGATTPYKTVEEMKNYMESEFVRLNTTKLIIPAIAKRVAANRDEAWNKKLGNYQPPKGQNPGATPALVKGSIEHYMAAMDN